MGAGTAVSRRASPQEQIASFKGSTARCWSGQGVKQPAPPSETDLSPDVVKGLVCRDARGESSLREEGLHEGLSSARPWSERVKVCVERQVSEQGWQFTFV